MGETNSLTGVIKINKNLMDSQKITTLLHEVMHVVNSQYEEKEVDNIAEGIGQFLIDNKLLK